MTLYLVKSHSSIGDNPNDLPMLEKADIPVIVQKPDGEYYGNVDIPGVVKAYGIGPDGWNKAVIEIVNRGLIIGDIHGC